MTGFNPRPGGGTIRHPPHVEVAVPSPFPGMDPYLEDPYTWPTVHHQLTVELMGALNERITPSYFAQIELRVYKSDQDDPGRKLIVPDVRVLRGEGRRRPRAGLPAAPAGAAVCEPVTVVTVIAEEVREAFVRIVERESRKVVTIIEVLSPSNKVAGSRGRADFLMKRTATLNSATNWVEIDLLRAGEPVHAEEPYPECEYAVHVSKVADRPTGRIWPIRVTQRLPVIPIPLRGADPDVEIDLQSLFDSAYDRGACGVWVSYRTAPVPPLPPELAAWADALLRKKKLRGPGPRP